MKKVSIKIKGGSVSADFTGFQGKECERLDERIRPMELEIEEQELKPEYHQESTFSETEHNEW
jgi:hypothetical protein